MSSQLTDLASEASSKADLSKMGGCNEIHATLFLWNYSVALHCGVKRRGFAICRGCFRAMQ